MGEKTDGQDDGQEHTLLMMVGLPYSGKSTWARKQGVPIVSPDEIRLSLHGHRYLQKAEPMVWLIARIMVESLFRAGHNRIILDGCNVSAARRSEWFGTKMNVWCVELHIMCCPVEECIDRAKTANDTDILPVIERMDDEYEDEDHDPPHLKKFWHPMEVKQPVE